jgi:uncharacterized glyoxalase superfamily protein PhnB
MAIKGTGIHTGQVIPHLLIRNLAEALKFYQQAFRAVELYRSPMPGGQGLHAQMRIGEALILLSEEGPQGEHEWAGFGSPQTLGGTTVTLQIYVDDVDRAFQRALDAGAAPVCEPGDFFWGDRYSMVRDPFGHSWALGTVKEELTPNQVQERMRTYEAQFAKDQR